MLRDSFFIYKHEYYCDEERDGAGHALLILSCSMRSAPNLLHTGAVTHACGTAGLGPKTGFPTVSWRPEPTHKG
jgi:hypothetical protein